MNTHVRPLIKTRLRDVCTRPEIGALLPDYIVDLAEESTCEKVEEHLLECHSCKEQYVTILRIRYAPRTRNNMRRCVDRANNESNVVSLCDFKSRHA